MNMLKVTNLKVSYGGIEALKGISFDVEQGQIVTLIGANGAGKSTTLRSISGLVTPADGTINFMGQNITGHNPQRIVTDGIIQVPEGRRVFANLTVKENLKIGAYLRKDKDEIEAQYALESSSQPLGISSYELSNLIPDNYKGSMPTIEEVEAELAD